MDKNSIIGIVLIFILFYIWAQLNAPTPEQLAEQKRLQDSVMMAQERPTQEAPIPPTTTGVTANSGVTENGTPQETAVVGDSVRQIQLAGAYGPFAGAASGTEQEYTLENEKVVITFSNKGGWIKQVKLKDYKKLYDDENKVQQSTDLLLLEDEKNRFDYILPIAGMPSGGIRTGDLYFTATENENKITFRADAGQGRYFEQRFSLRPDSYGIDYDIHFEGMGNMLNGDIVKLDWVNYLDKIEKNVEYERYYCSVFFKPTEDGANYCSCRADDEEDIQESVKWVSHTNQFFSSALMADKAFSNAVVKTKMLEADDDNLKVLSSEIDIPLARQASETFAMQLFVGPNEFDRLKTYGSDLEYTIPYGWSIFGTINRWIIRPLFKFLNGFIGSKGIVILILTLLVKLVLYPLTYKMLYSQSKMAALKPRIEAMKKKSGDDAQKQQMETMKMYREFGVNPLGGCMPMVLQMPIWYALFRFFPASIDFRQASFLWASDLSSFDVFASLPFEIPFYGAHVSLFTILWALTTIIYTYYNTKHMDMSANPAMLYMQYFMPVMFLFFFNNYASGLTCYMFFSNLLNITQTIGTKNFIINKDKINKELEDYKKKPKKKGGFQERLETALKEQQKQQAEREGQLGKHKKKKK